MVSGSGAGEGEATIIGVRSQASVAGCGEARALDWGRISGHGNQAFVLGIGTEKCAPRTRKEPKPLSCQMARKHTVAGDLPTLDRSLGLHVDDERLL